MVKTYRVTSKINKQSVKGSETVTQVPAQRGRS